MSTNYRTYLTHKVFSIISSIAERNNIPTYIVGGFVRDIILQRPNKDIDIVVVGSGIELAQKLSKENGFNKLTVYKNFGTAMLRFEDLEIEFVGARKESYRRDSRKPIVEEGTLKDDQLRRDFTINAMSISLNADSFGELIDPFGGLVHCEQKTIQTPLDPENTFSDDPLRMMRAIRFASQLQFEIEAQTFQAIQKNVNRLEIISKERIHEELNKIILSPKPSVGFKLLYDSGLLKQVLPELQALQGIDVVEGQRHKDNFYHTIEVVDNIAPKTENLWLRWAALLHDVGKARTKKFEKGIGWTFHGHEFLGGKMVPKIFKNLKLPQDQKMKYVAKLVTLSARPIALISDDTSDSAVRRLIFEAGDDLEDLMTLCEADITSKNPERVKRYSNNYKLVRKKLAEVEESDRIRNFQPPVDGQEIMNYFKLKPGKEIGILKNAIREAILDGEIPNDYEAAKSFMIAKGNELGLTPN